MGMAVWSKVVGFLVIGYLCMTRSFSYFGVPPLFIGEIVLGAFLVLKPRVLLGTWVSALLRSSPLNAFSMALLVFMLFGVWQMSRGVFAGHSFLETFKFFIFNYYALYLFLGIWVGLNAPDFLPKLMRFFAWVQGIYGMLWVAGLDRMADSITLPGGQPLGWPGGAAFAILGVLCFERNLRGAWHVLALNILVTVAMQIRAQWLGLACGMLVWGALTGRIGRVMGMGLAGIAVLGMIELAGIQLPGRTGNAVSIGETLGRALAPIDTDLAEQFSPDAKRHIGTADWRSRWWNAIWDSVHSSPMLEAFGHGYGFYLMGLLDENERGPRSTWNTRTPHSAFYFALGYTGWAGVGLMIILQLTILRLAWNTFNKTGQPFGVALWTLGIAAALFEQSFDTPYKAIPFYLLMGLAVAPGLMFWGGTNARPTRAQFLSTARR